MRRAWPVAGILIAATVAIVVYNNEAQVVPNPTTCEGYPEQRVFLENQSWVEPQPGDPAHPGTGTQGHIHVSTCFPLHQNVTSDTLALDIRVQLHNVPGTPTRLDLITYRVGQGANGHRVSVPYTTPCPTVDCDFWMHVDFPLSEVSESGPTEFHIYFNVENADGKRWYNVTRWWFNLDNGAPDANNSNNNLRIGGDTWLAVTGNQYAEVRIDTDDFPWDFESGQLIPISGVWEPGVFYTQEGRHFAMVDPALHAVPPVFNTILEGIGRGAQTLSVDTTLLSDGVHRLLLSSCTQTQGFEHCGVLVVRFLVANGTTTTTTSTSSTTTTFSTTTTPPTVIDLEPGENLIVNCSTTLSGIIDDQIANLSCSEG